MSAVQDGSVFAWATMTPKAPVVEWSFQPRELKDDEVEIKVTHCGLCHSDVSQIDDDWGGGLFPMVAGHEVIGIVLRVGERVDSNKFYNGLRVGLGPQRDCCRNCDYCHKCDESGCSKAVWTYNAKFADGTCCYGGYAAQMRVYHRFLHPIPDSMPSVNAPLLCAGITTYFPFTRHNLRPGSKVGVIGVGGLGHLALQYSSKMGHNTVAISTSASKKEEAASFGARDFLLSTDADAFSKEARSFDLLLTTASSSKEVENLTPYLNLIKPGGTFVLSGVQGLNIQASSLTMILQRVAIEGSNIGGSIDMDEMLRFSAMHNVTPKVEVLPFSQVNHALDKVRQGTARYRMVLQNE